jgi:hypothetical protein
MSGSDAVLARMRRYLLVLAGASCLGVIAELTITGHYETPVQALPFVLCGLGAIVSLLALLRPTRPTLLALRAIMLLAALGGAFGTFEHLEQNLAFAREVNAAKADASPLSAALTGGNPPLAPGALGVAAMIALVATHAHPAMGKKNGS